MEKDFYRDLGKKLRAYRRQRDLTMGPVAKRLNKSVATVSKYENGDIEIGLDVLYDYCSLLNVDVTLLLTPSGGEGLVKGNERYTSSFIDFLWLYWYKHVEKKIHISAVQCDNASMKATFLHDVRSYKNIYDCDFIYHGEVTYSDHNIDFHFKNIGAPYDMISMRLPTLVKQREYRIGMILSTDFAYRSVAIKCLTSKKPILNQDFLIEKLKISPGEIKKIREVNFFVTDVE